MAIEIVTLAAASATVGVDVLRATDSVCASQGVDRALTGVGLTGSAAAGDTFIDIYIDDQLVTTVTNTVTGIAAPNDHLLPLEPRLIPANAKLKAKVTDAPASNPIFLIISHEKLM